MYHHALMDTIRPDHPADSAVRVLAHWGDMSFVQLTSMTGNTEDCMDVKFDFNHEHIVVQEKKTEDKFQIKMYF